MKLKNCITKMKLEGYRKKGNLIIKLPSRKVMDIREIPYHFKIDIDFKKDIKAIKEKKE